MKFWNCRPDRGWFLNSGTMLKKIFANPIQHLPIQEMRETFYLRMLAIRLCEEKLLALVEDGLVRGTVHTCLGQEGCAVGVVSALDRARDIVCSNHRGHGHYLTYSGDISGLLAEILGLQSGVCGGVGGSQHLHRDNFYTNGILGGMPPVAVGMAAAEARLGSGAVVCVFLGDGAMAEGSFYEALNMAALWKLPVLFAIEHNHYAQSTHWEKQHAGKLEARAQTFGVPVMVVDGNDVESVYAAASVSIDNLRSGQGPGLLFMNTYRLGPHSKGDDLRPLVERDIHWKKEPLVRLSKKLDTTWCEDQIKNVSAQIDKISEGLLAGAKQ